MSLSGNESENETGNKSGNEHGTGTEYSYISNYTVRKPSSP